MKTKLDLVTTIIRGKGEHVKDTHFDLGRIITMIHGDLNTTIFVDGGTGENETYERREKAEVIITSGNVVLFRGDTDKLRHQLLMEDQYMRFVTIQIAQIYGIFSDDHGDDDRWRIGATIYESFLTSEFNDEAKSETNAIHKYLEVNKSMLKKHFKTKE